jgi:hypothetical protein
LLQLSVDGTIMLSNSVGAESYSLMSGFLWHILV